MQQAVLETQEKHHQEKKQMAVNSVLKGCDRALVYLYLLLGFTAAEWTGRGK